MDYAALFESSLAVIDRVVAGVCRRAGVFGADAEDFASAAKVALMEDDYAVLRPYEGRSSLATFLAIVIHRLLLDERTKRTGRWHASREAERLGEAGVVLERIVRRERRSIDEALPFLQAIDPGMTRARAVEMEARLPLRAVRPRPVDLEEAGEQLVASERADERAVAAETGALSERVGRIVRDALEGMSVEDRMIIRFHFGSAMTIADISGLLRLPQRPLYRRVEALLRRLHGALEAAGIAARDVRDLLGSTTREIDFGLHDWKHEGKSDPGRQTNPGETTVREAG
jgi:RNA polymerase sigma factor (sigma-70 family)